MSDTELLGLLIIFGLIGFIFYLEERGFSINNIFVTPKSATATTVAKTTAVQPNAINNLLSSQMLTLSELASGAIQNVTFQAADTLRVMTGNTAQVFQRVGTSVGQGVASTGIPGAGVVTTGLETGTGAAGSIVGGAGDKVATMSTDLAGSGALPVILYGIGKVLTSGFRGASETQQKAILGQQTVAGLQTAVGMLAGVIPGLGLITGPLLGAFFSSKIGLQTTAQIGRTEEQMYLVAKKQPVSVGAGAAAGAAYGSVIPGLGTALGAAVGALGAIVAGGAFEGGSSHQQRLSEFTGAVKGRVAEFANGALATQNDVDSFQRSIYDGITWVDTGSGWPKSLGKVIDLPKLKITPGANPFGLTPPYTSVAVGNNTYKVFPSLGDAQNSGPGSFYISNGVNSPMGQLSIVGSYGFTEYVNGGSLSSVKNGVMTIPVSSSPSGQGWPYLQNGSLVISGPKFPIQPSNKIN